MPSMATNIHARQTRHKTPEEPETPDAGKCVERTFVERFERSEGILKMFSGSAKKEP